MTTEIIQFDKPERIGEVEFTADSKPFGIWRIPNREGAWALGVEVFTTLGYTQPSASLNDFVNGKAFELNGLVFRQKLSDEFKSQRGNPTRTFLHEDAIFDVLLSQYSRQPIAKEYCQRMIEEVMYPYRTTGVVIHKNIEESIEDMTKAALSLLQQLNPKLEQVNDHEHRIQQLEASTVVDGVDDLPWKVVDRIEFLKDIEYPLIDLLKKAKKADIIKPKTKFGYHPFNKLFGLKYHYHVLYKDRVEALCEIRRQEQLLEKYTPFDPYWK